MSRKEIMVAVVKSLGLLLLWWVILWAMMGCRPIAASSPIEERQPLVCPSPSPGTYDSVRGNAIIRAKELCGGGS